MSLLTEELPSAVTFGGESYEVKTDFRDWLRFYDSAEKGDILGMLRVYRRLPPSMEKALELAAEFGRGGALSYGGKEAGRRPVLDFEADAALIYAAFMGEYGLDLCEARLHWYKFCALLWGLGEDRTLSRIMALRAMDPACEGDSGRRRELRRLQRLYACPDRRSAEEKEADAIKALELFY